MTDITTARSDLASHFITEWGATTAFVIEDEGFEDAAGAPADPPDEWVRFAVRHFGPRPGQRGPQVNLGGPGNRKFERGGSVICQVFTPLTDGSKRGDQLGQLILDAFEAKQIANVKAEGGEIREAAPSGRWRQTMVEIPIYYEATK